MKSWSRERLEVPRNWETKYKRSHAIFTSANMEIWDRKLWSRKYLHCPTLPQKEENKKRKIRNLKT